MKDTCRELDIPEEWRALPWLCTFDAPRNPCEFQERQLRLSQPIDRWNRCITHTPDLRVCGRAEYDSCYGYTVFDRYYYVCIGLSFWAAVCTYRRIGGRYPDGYYGITPYCFRSDTSCTTEPEEFVQYESQPSCYDDNGDVSKQRWIVRKEPLERLALSIDAKQAEARGRNPLYFRDPITGLYNVWYGYRNSLPYVSRYFNFPR